MNRNVLTERPGFDGPWQRAVDVTTLAMKRHFGFTCPPLTVLVPLGFRTSVWWRPWGNARYVRIRTDDGRVFDKKMSG